MLYLAQVGGQWLQRMDGNSVLTLEEFKTHVAEQFGVDPTTVSVSARDGDPYAVAAQLAAGVFEGAPVVAAPGSPPPPPSKKALAVAAIDKLVAKKKTDPDLEAVLVAFKDAL